MATASNTYRASCTQCSSSFAQGGPGRRRDRCYQCSPVRRDQKLGRRKNAKPCLGCGCTLSSARAKRCAPCNKEFYQAYQRDRWASSPKWQRPEQHCDGCSASFTPHVPTQRYCSKLCRAKADSRRASDVRPLYRYARWLRLRREQLQSELLCRFCLIVGRETAATVCDHVVPHRGDVDAFWSGPFQSLCVGCHNRDKQRLERRST